MSVVSPGVRTESPRSAAEAGALLGATRGSVLVRGAGTALDWGGGVGEPDLMIDTSALTGEIEHNPADLTVAVGAGTRLVDLQEQLGRAGQWLPFDPPTGPDGATLGGLLATGESGPSRLRSGPLRDLVIGSTLVLADGTVARSGGRVIKNVAGYDLTKLASGSLGALALVAEVVLRVHPRPAASVTLRARTDLATASATALRLFSSTVEPAALEWSSADGTFGDLLVRIDGGRRRVTGAGDLVRRTLVADAPGLEELSDQDAATAWETHRVRALGPGSVTTVALHGLPDRVPALGAAVRDLDPACGLTCSLAVGSVVVGLTGVDPPLSQLRRTAERHGSTMLLRRRPAGLVVEGAVAVGPPPSSAVLMRRLKDALDPERRFAPGRFAPWF